MTAAGGSAPAGNQTRAWETPNFIRQCFFTAGASIAVALSAFFGWWIGAAYVASNVFSCVLYWWIGTWNVRGV